MSEMKNTLDEMRNRLDTLEKKAGKLEDRNRNYQKWNAEKK